MSWELWWQIVLLVLHVAACVAFVKGVDSGKRK